MAKVKTPTDVAVLYLRFSSSRQRTESIDAQRSACLKHAKKDGLTIIREYVDEAESATSDNRPAFQEMMQDAKQKKFGILICHKLDRFCRNLHDYVVNKMSLSKLGVKIKFADQPMDDRPEDILLESLLAGIAEYYSRNLSKETLKGMTENALNGKFNGGKVPFGYELIDGVPVVDQKKAKAIQLAFAQYVDGHSVPVASVAVFNKFGLEIDPDTIRTMLNNEKYAGVLTFGKRSRCGFEPIRIEGGWPAIVTKEVFDAVQKRMKRRSISA